ncbi:hypothetical protein PFISCL1PPCAC_26042 [Pristionchus fissidentatus]|uniref:Uncharacterized protein n=1 Tax=Pristionchus fissidentatus TaxID=1538716 RepID=A0AAV5WT11_9BILA|nr:hypothetical protein PFISCL1PPCAC_26042 [Pristionchus fissidentatus]
MSNATFIHNGTISFAEDGDPPVPDPAPDAGLSGGAIAGIVIAAIVGTILLLLAAFFGYRWLKERRKNHGEYKPHEEEEEHAKNLPYLAPPSVEGLI